MAAVVVLPSACVRPTTGPPAAPAAHPAIRLHVDPSLAAADFLSPAIGIESKGRRAWLLVDTGAAIHTWARWFVDAAALPAASPPADAEMKDSTDTTLDVDWVAPVELSTLEGARLTIGPAAVVPFPPEFEKAGVAGIVSPQLLAGPGEAAVLDLRGSLLRVMPETVAFAGVTADDRAETCAQHAGALRTLAYAVTAQVDGVPVRLTLDTGANHTKLRAAAVPRLAERATGTGTTSGLGGRSEPVRLAPAAVSFGGRSVDVEARLVEQRESDCGPDGLLGIDVLSGCTLVLAPTRLAALCRP